MWTEDRGMGKKLWMWMEVRRRLKEDWVGVLGEEV
jgi:hypothetical protein